MKKDYTDHFSNQYSLTREIELETEISFVKSQIKNLQQELEQLEADLYILQFGLK